MSVDSDSPGVLDERLLERVSDGFLALDADLEVSYLNDAAVELFDVERGDVGDTGDGVVPALEDAGVLEPVRRAWREHTDVTFEVELDAGTSLEGTAYPAEEGVSVFVRDVTAHGTVLRAREQETVLERLHAVASDPSSSREEKAIELLDIGTEFLDVPYGFLTRIEDGTQEILYSVGDHSGLAAGTTTPLSEAYCQYTLENGETLAIPDALAEGWEDEPAYERFGLECYLGIVLSVDGEQYGTVCFVDTEPRRGGFDEAEQTVVEVLSDWFTAMLEQAAYERELENQKAFTESLIDSLPDVVYAFDGDGTLLRWNDRLERVTGYTGGEVEERTLADFVAPGDRERVCRAFQSVLEGEDASVEAKLRTRDGTHAPYEFSGAPLYDERGEIAGATGVGRDVTEQYAHRERLSTILETTRSLMQARDREHVGELAANAARELLGEELTVFRLYDADEETLEPVSPTDSLEETIGERPTYDVDEGYPGEVFASGEPVIVADFADEGGDYALGDGRSAMYYPVGVHGTISVVSTEPGAFDETDQDVLALLATSAAAACNRAKRMREIREAREHTERVLDRVNGLVRNTVEVLVQARTREELEAGVVEELAATDPYAFAWIGQPDVATDRLHPTAWAGEPSLALEDHSVDLTHERDPVVEAYRDGTTRIVTDVRGEGGTCADVVAGSGLDALVIIPLVYKEATYGVLAVCAEEGDVFDDRERAVLDALGRAVANAINAVERGRILEATEIIELEFAVDSPDLLFNRLSADTDGRLEVVGTDYRSDGRVRLYISATDGPPEELVERARADSEVLAVTTIVEHDDECLIELDVEESLMSVLAEYGAVTREVVADDGSTRFTVELPYETEAREVFELVERRHPGTDLLGYHERERAVETRQDFRAALGDRLTDRQETALRTAYLGGFFDWPREVDGNELAEAMDISRPTYHQHLRTAQAKVFEELFE